MRQTGDLLSCPGLRRLLVLQNLSGRISYECRPISSLTIFSSIVVGCTRPFLIQLAMPNIMPTARAVHRSHGGRIRFLLTSNFLRGRYFYFSTTAICSTPGTFLYWKILRRALNCFSRFHAFIAHACYQNTKVHL